MRGGQGEVIPETGFKLSVDVTCHVEVLEIEGLFTP